MAESHSPSPDLEATIRGSVALSDADKSRLLGSLDLLTPEEAVQLELSLRQTEKKIIEGAASDPAVVAELDALFRGQDRTMRAARESDERVQEEQKMNDMFPDAPRP